MSPGTSLIGQVEIQNTNLTKSLVSMVESDISAMELQLPDNEDSNNTGCATCYNPEYSRFFKGQLISKCPFGVKTSSKKTTIFFPGFLP